MMGISKTTHQDESGNTVDYTDEEKEELAAKVADFAKSSEGMMDLDAGGRGCRLYGKHRYFYAGR
mgnify:CR=1 FL=1